MLDKHYEGQGIRTNCYKANKTVTIRLSEDDLEFLRQLFPDRQNISYAIRSLIHEKRNTTSLG